MLPVLVMQLHLLSNPDGSGRVPPVRVDSTVRMTDGGKAPKLKFHPQPVYTWQAREAGAQGSCILDVVVDEQGVPGRIRIVSPMGFGLDETTQDAVSHWRFKPTIKNGTPMPVETTVEVRFRLLDRSFDQKAEDQRLEFNKLITALRVQPNHNPTSDQIARMEALSEQGLTPAQYVFAVWQLDGEFVPRNRDAGLALLTSAIEKNYPRALTLMGELKIKGDLVAKDAEGGLKLLREASVMGDEIAQLKLARRYRSGELVGVDLERSRHYYRLCAANGNSECQLQLASILLTDREPAESTRLQAVAWFQLAAERGSEEARQRATMELARLNEDQSKLVARIKKQLVQNGQ